MLPIDPVDIGTLVDMFRAEKNSCLLGTDAVRDGVDVPGDALRLIVLDRVPWPVPSILERARREKLGGSAWTEATCQPTIVGISTIASNNRSAFSP